jgi:DNA-binding CsgD family transcriptional regulator
VRLFVLEPQRDRRGLAACVSGLPDVETVYAAGSVGEARAHPGLRHADLVLLDPAVPGSREFIGAVHHVTAARVIVASAADTGVAGEGGLARLTDREQQVLALIADGHPTREVAERLCYSERTVKSVVHDAVTKLNARSRSQAVAQAVREGLI